MAEPVFLTMSQVLYIHQDLVDEFGGSHGLRDEGLFICPRLRPESVS